MVQFLEMQFVLSFSVDWRMLLKLVTKYTLSYLALQQVPMAVWERSIPQPQAHVVRLQSSNGLGRMLECLREIWFMQSKFFLPSKNQSDFGCRLHGSGTPIGDALELEGMNLARIELGASEVSYFAGSNKGNIGNCEVGGQCI
jgi:hypothetical protein